MECPECGSAIGEDDKFCVQCGHQLQVEGAAAAAQQADAAGAAEPAGKPTVVTLPRWLAADWPVAALFAATALLLGLALQYVAAVLLVLIQVSLGVGVDWAEIARVPIDAFTAFHGSIDNIGIWATSMLWIVFGFWLAGRVVRPEHDIPAEDSGSRWAMLITKTAIVYAVPVTLLAGLLDPEPLPVDIATGVAGSVSGGFGAEWNVASTFLLGLVAAAIAALWTMARRTGRPALALLGLGGRFAAPSWLRAAGAGARRTLLIALPALLVLLAVGTLLEALNDGRGVGGWFAFLLAVLLGVVFWAGLDVATIFSIMSMRFFLGDTEDFFGGQLPAWMWIGVGIIVVAFVLGGNKAAERFRAETAASAVGVGMLVGVVVAAVLFVISWFTIGINEVLSGPALGLPLLWSLAAGMGGLLYANKQGFISGIQFKIADAE